jgi:hypothetical protein
LRSFPKTELILPENQRYRDDFRDLSGTLSLAFHATAPTARVSPYVATGLGVHVLSSSFGSLAIDRDNTNNPGCSPLLARLRTDRQARAAHRSAAGHVHDVSRIHLAFVVFGELAPAPRWRRSLDGWPCTVPLGRATMA